jgi:3-hydroxy-9,10-secoandrosta-1,3,5(10)-triene-9,17-dione monooxygenase reductase component
MGRCRTLYFLAMAGELERREFRETCAAFATGVCVVTSLGEDGPSGMTANAVTSLSLDPPLMIVCFALSARTLTAVRHSNRFGVQFLAAGQDDLAARFASKLPEEQKFDGVAWTERSGVPSIDGCLGWLGCELRELRPGGDHMIGVGEVADMWHVRGDPLVFFEGDYWSLTSRGHAPPEVDEALEGPPG